MDINQFANYALALLIALQFIGMFIYLLLWNNMGAKSLWLSSLIVFVLDVGVLQSLRLFKVYDDDGKKVDDLFGKTIGDVIAVVVWTAISSAVFALGGWYFSHNSAVKYEYNKFVAFLVPVLATAVFYGALGTTALILKK